ncbi:42165_t:CDS:2, partial [Gigaspora margarita]
MTTSTKKFSSFLPNETDKIKHSIAGAVAGCVSSIVTCPLDVVKTRLQNQGKVTNDQRVPPYRGTGKTLKRIWIEEGIRGLYRGLGPTLYGYLPTWAIYFSAYDYFKSVLGERSGATSTIVTNPLWVIKTRFMVFVDNQSIEVAHQFPFLPATQNQTTTYLYRNTFHAFSTIYEQEGMKGFYKGLGPSLMGVSHVAVQFPLYEKMKVWLKSPDKELSNLSILFASSVSKMAASIATYPHEVVRTRLQNQTCKPFKYLGIWHAVNVIRHEEGFLAFYKGMSTNLLRTVPASALTILTYEVLVRKLNANSDRN